MAAITEEFLAQVLRSYEDAQNSPHKKMIGDISAKILGLKLQVKDMIEGKYVDFTRLPKEHRQMVTDSKVLSNQINKLTDKIENEIKQNLINSTGELKNLSDHLQEVTLESTIVHQMVSLDESFKLAAKLQENKDYCKVASTLIMANFVLKRARQNNPDVELFEALNDESSLISGTFLDDMMDVWGKYLKESIEKIGPNVTSYSLSVNVTRTEEIEQMFQALNIFDHLDMYFEMFANRLYKTMLLPIIMQGATVTTEVEVDDKFLTMIVEVDTTAKKRPYTEVFEGIRHFFNFINLNLKVNIEENITLMNKLGEIISEDLVKALVEHCVADTIPCHSNKLDEFNVVISETGSMQTYLKVIGILKENNVTLQDYTRNVEYLCANKTCRILLEKARIIMKKDLYDLMEVTVDGTSTPSEMQCGTHAEPSIKVNTKMFAFPQCKISKSAADLLAVINQILFDCATSTDLCAVRLFCTARNIVELYCAVVPKYHEKFLDIPQIAALFNNNCMYLAHHLMVWGSCEERRKLPEVLRSHMTTFIDQIQELRTTGTTVFLKHMKMQRDQVLDIIRNSGLATLREKRAVAADTEKAVRQCLRQLELLQSVWFTVLPLNIYCKAIGCLVNSFIDELISKVTSVEDIPADMATQLGQIFSVVTARVPVLFPEPKEVHRFVAKWAQFLELIIILAASMKEITERWASGKGPMALLFPPDQVRQLIRALFQNTDRRAAVLNSIK